MRAVVLTDLESGPSLVQMPVPAPADGEVLIHVLGSSVNAMDVSISTGRMRGVDYEFPFILGRDFAGVIEGLKGDTGSLHEGQEVFGFITMPRVSGSWADYVTFSAESMIAAKPESLDFVQAGAVPLAGLTGMLGVEAVEPKTGDWVLIVGATGGVGSYAMKLAAARGVNVIATAKANEQDYVRRLGAAETVDYSTQDVADAVRALHPQGINGLIDLVNRTPEDFAKVADLVMSGGGAASSLGAADAQALGRRNVHATNLSSSGAEPAVLRRLAQLVDDGEIKPPIAHIYPLDDTPRALEDFAKGTLGKLAVALG